MTIRHVLWYPFLAIFLAGCAQPLPQYRVHHSFIESPQTRAPRKVLVLPVDVVIKEVTAGGVAEEVPDWSRKGSANVLAALTKQLRSGGTNRAKLQLLDTPKLPEADTKAIQQHLALYRRVAATVFSVTYGERAWPQKIYRFDYTLGNGLKSVAGRTGADSAILLMGEDSVSTAGRKLAALFLDSVSYGHSYLTAAIVNLNTGDILWFNYAYQYKSADLREPDDAAKLVAQLFEEYPGVEQYKAGSERYKDLIERYKADGEESRDPGVARK